MSTDRIFGIGFLGLGVALFAYSFSFRQADLMGDLGPGFLPGLVGALLAVLGAIQAIRAKHSAASTTEKGRTAMAVVFFVAVSMYALLFTWFGFSWPSFIFLVSVMALLGHRTLRSLVTYTVVAAVFVLLVGWVLLDVLAVPLRGVWFIN